MTFDPIVTKRHPPKHSRLSGWYERADLVDSFAVRLPSGINTNIRSIGQAILGQPAPWFKALLAIRDNIVHLFGLQTSAELRGKNTEKNRIDFFPILFADDNELILGEDDRHLDFRISLMVKRAGGGPPLVFATTAVRCNNQLGRVYLAAIKPFHRLVVRSHLQRAAKAGFVTRPRV